MDISTDNDLCMYHVCIMIMEIFHLYIYIMIHFNRIFDF